MDLRPLTETYAVAPQIEPGDLAGIAAAGYTTVICNRPDGEVPPPLQAAAIRAEAERHGLVFVENPVLPGQLTPEVLARQEAAMAAADGPVLAYCASGNRSSIVWSFLKVGEIGVDSVLAATHAAGYAHEPLRPQFAAYAAETPGPGQHSGD